MYFHSTHFQFKHTINGSRSFILVDAAFAHGCSGFLVLVRNGFGNVLSFVPGFCHIVAYYLLSLQLLNTKALLKVLLLTTVVFVVWYTQSQNVGAITPNPVVWNLPDNTTSLLRKDATHNATAIDVLTNGNATISQGDAKHNLQPLMSAYSVDNYYPYEASNDTLFGKWSDGVITTTTSSDYSTGIYYLPITIFVAAGSTSAGIDKENIRCATSGLGISSSGLKFGASFFKTRNTPPAVGNLVIGLNGTETTIVRKNRKTVRPPSLKIRYCTLSVIQ